MWSDFWLCERHQKMSVHQDELSALVTRGLRRRHTESDEMKCGCCLQGQPDMSCVCGQRRHHQGNMTGIAWQRCTRANTSFSGQICVSPIWSWSTLGEKKLLLHAILAVSCPNKNMLWARAHSFTLDIKLETRAYNIRNRLTGRVRVAVDKSILFSHTWTSTHTNYSKCPSGHLCVNLFRLEGGERKGSVCVCVCVYVCVCVWGGDSMFIVSLQGRSFFLCPGERVDSRHGRS